MQFERKYLVCLLQFHNLTDVAMRFASQKNAAIPPCIIEICKIIAKAKLKIIMKHQSSGEYVLLGSEIMFISVDYTDR